MPNKKFNEDIFLGEINFDVNIGLCVTRGKLSENDILVHFRDFSINEFWKIPKHIHWIFDVMIKKEHNDNLLKSFVNYLQNKWEKLDSDFCSDELRKLHNKNKKLIDIYKEIEDELSLFKELDTYGYYPINFLGLFGYLMILQEKNNRYDAYKFKDMLNGVSNNIYNPYKVISIATDRYS